MTTQTEALNQAKQKIESAMKCHPNAVPHLLGEAWDFINEALAQPEQRSVSEYLEPVAWLHWLHGPVRLFLNKDEAMMELDRLNREYPVDKNARQMKPLYTTPPTQQSCSQRQCNVKPWVSLTDEEIITMSRYDLEYAALIGEVQRKLKEKNT